MGHLEQQLIGPARGRLNPLITRACADEWHAHYNFLFLAWTLAGHRAPSVITLLREMSAQALARADELARRLCQLGGRPPERLAEVVKSATDKPFKLPDDPTNVDGALTAVLDAQRTSLRTYNELWKTATYADPVTAETAARFLAAAARDEETLERLLGRPAPAMDGTAK